MTNKTKTIHTYASMIHKLPAAQYSSNNPHLQSSF